MTISLLLPDLRGGGAERVCVDLARAVAAAGHRVEFVLMQARGEFLAEARREFPVVDLGVRKTRQVPLPLARYLRARKPDALIAHMWPLTSAAVLARMLSGQRTRLLLVEHNTLSSQYASWGRVHGLMMRASLRASYRWADRVAAVSEGAARDTGRLAGLGETGVCVLHNPIPQRGMPTPEAMQRAEQFWNAAPGGRVLTVGSLKAQKNHPLLLRAFARVQRPDARLMILGGGDDAPLRRLAAELGIADRVVLAGFHPDPTPFYRTADLFVLSSDHEGLPTVLVEALAQGTPVVSTDCPAGPAEILEGGRWGRLVPPGDAGALAAAIDEALAATHDRAALQRRAADFAPEIAARRYLELLFPA